MQLRDDYNPQDLGYRNFFTNDYDGNMVAMQFARANNNLNNRRSCYHSPDIIKNTYMSGAMHFGGVAYTKYDSHVYYDLDIKEAYATWLINYKRGNFGYYVGGKKVYYNDYDFFQPKRTYDGIVLHRISFAIRTENPYTSRLYRLYLLKSRKIMGFKYTDDTLMGTILIPDINNLPNMFLDEVQGYEEHDVRYEGTIKTSDANAVYINDKNLVEALEIKNNKSHPLHDYYKLMINSSTGYLAHADKVLYYTMINHVRTELIRLIDYIERYNKGRDDCNQIRVLAANTDGITVYAHKDLERVIESFLAYEINSNSVFTFLVKDIYKVAHETSNDVRRGKAQWQNNLN